MAAPLRKDLTIRPAVLSDAPAISSLKIQTFRETFVDPPEKGGFGVPYPAKDLEEFEKDCYDVAVIEQELKGGKDGKTKLWVVLGDDEKELVGYLKIATVKLPHPDVSEGSDEGEICQLYLKRGYQDRGLGSKLMQIAISSIEATYGAEKQIWVGVWSENYKAQRFYNRYGFTKAGEYRFVVGSSGWSDHEFIFRRPAGWKKETV
jgi:diamine N-acetyltransferase